MTRVSYDPDAFRLEIRGHAGAAPAGQDLVCAGISVLSFALINAAMSVEDYHGHVMVEGEDALIRVECCPEESAEERCREMFRTVMCGFDTLEESYPEYLTLTGGE